MKSNLSEFEQEPYIRPALLNVLCILTFIGSTWAIVTNIWVYKTASQTAKMVSYMKNKNKNMNMTDSIGNRDSVIIKASDKKRSVFGEKMMLSITKIFTEETIRKNALGTIASAIFTLLGGILMWRLKRIGFYLYVAGTIIGIIVPLYLYGNNLIAIGISSFSSFFGLVFIALYALNFRALRK